MQRDGSAEFEVCDAAAPEAAPAVERPAKARGKRKTAGVPKCGKHRRPTREFRRVILVVIEFLNSFHPP